LNSGNASRPIVKIPSAESTGIVATATRGSILLALAPREQPADIGNGLVEGLRDLVDVGVVPRVQVDGHAGRVGRPLGDDDRAAVVAALSAPLDPPRRPVGDEAGFRRAAPLANVSVDVELALDGGRILQAKCRDVRGQPDGIRQELECRVGAARDREGSLEVSQGRTPVPWCSR
jgi:hypothetical protein